MADEKCFIYVFITAALWMSVCDANPAIKRQGAGNVAVPAAPARDLLPPPALSASFPTLRPHPPRNSQSPNLNLIPPFRPPGVKGIPQPPPPPSPPQDIRIQSELLPPIEIPPASPLSDAEIAQLFVESSFVPTTGQGIGTGNGNSRDSIQLTIDEPVTVRSPPQSTPKTVVVSEQSSGIRNSSSTAQVLGTNVRFPDVDPPNPSLKSCPSCECTSEVDYICGSNGVIYLNSCSFDCATFCDGGLRKAPLEVCALPNHL